PLGANSEGISNLDPTALFPFGHGLSYTSFEYSALALSDTEIATDAAVEISVTVRNTGECAGDEVVQLYLHRTHAETVRPLKELAGFARLTLEPGAAARVTFTLHADRTGYTGVGLR